MGLSRRLARRKALQLLYQIDLTQSSPDEAWNQSNLKEGLSASAQEFAYSLVAGVRRHVEERLLDPGLTLDGPLQYDAASVADVGRQKAPNSKVAGQATVFVFPDLNTGNTTYKAVQRSANVVSVGPMLQGLRKPVNDLSRGALVDDIVFTIALTAIQAQQIVKDSAAT